MSCIIHGNFGEHSFTVSDLSISMPMLAGEDPSVQFHLLTPYGEEPVDEPVHDGRLPNSEGCWVDRLTIDMPEDDREELLEKVNAALRPYVAGTSLVENVVSIEALMKGVTLRFDSDAPFNVWKVDRETEEHLEKVFETHSLHQVVFHLDLMEP